MPVAASWDEEDDPGISVGAKARGLLSLPASWTPPFVALDAEAVSSMCNNYAPPLPVATLLARAPGRVLVRSDGPDEVLHPGRGTTLVTRPDPAEVRAALACVRSAPRRAAVIQIAVEPALVGMLSNERRISASPDEWLMEGEVSLSGPELRRFAVAGSAPASLSAADPAGVESVLRGVARALLEGGTRWRVEWLWDGERVWVVQADRVTDAAPSDVPPGPRAKAHPGDGTLRGDTNFCGRKLDRWKTFERLALPRTDILVVSGRRWFAETPEEIAPILKKLGPDPLVVRTDVRDGAFLEDVLLPTSGPSDDPHDLTSFMADTARRFAEHGLTAADWAFLVAALVPSQASAWVHATPSGAAQIDALWGYPDGLLHLPHDTFVVSVDGSFTKTVRYKPGCILPGDGAWASSDVPPPYDWHAVFDEEEARSAAALAGLIAVDAGQPVDVMVLARIGGARGASAQLPFHFTSAIGSRHATPRLPGAEREPATVTGPEDLASLADAEQAPVALRVRPRLDALRDADFLRAVGRYAANSRATVLFEGSRLGHAFHLLSDAGAVVAGSDESPPIDAAEWVTVVLERPSALSRVRSLPREQARRLAARTLAELATGEQRWRDAEAARRALAVLAPTGSRQGAPGQHFSRLARVVAHRADTDAMQPGWPGLPVLFDERRSVVPREAEHQWKPSTFEFPLAAPHIDSDSSTITFDVSGGWALDVRRTGGHATVRLRRVKSGQ